MSRLLPRPWLLAVLAAAVAATAAPAAGAQPPDLGERDWLLPSEVAPSGGGVLDHQDALAHDWIRLPIPKERQTFLEVAALGEQVAALLDPLVDATRVLEQVLGDDRRTLAVPSTTDEDAMRDADLVVTISYFGAARGGWQERAAREAEAANPAWGEGTGDLFLNESAFLANVPERVWRYELGGYPVIKKWLGYRDAKRRPGRPISLDELDHLRGMVHRIAALLILHDRLDGAYERAIADPFTGEELGV